jgi:hypothetical protein
MTGRIALMGPILLWLATGAPVTPAGLRDEAQRAIERKDFPTCGERLLAAVAAAGPAKRPDPDRSGNDAYNAACCFALAGQPARAFAALEEAARRGWRSTAHMGKDTDLEPLHADPRWAGALGAIEANEKRYLASVNAELARIYQEDQADRVGPNPEKIDWKVVRPRDEKRRRRVQQIVAAGGARAAADWFHAAMVLQHGEGPTDYKLAWQWAAQAARLDPEHPIAPWLSAAAEDRYLWAVDKPQKWGTQFKKVGGRWTLEPIDPAVTDAERERHKVPSLAEARRRAEQMNREWK